MIVSGDHVLFLSPSKQNFSFRGKHTLLLSLKSVKRYVFLESAILDFISLLDSMLIILSR